jgi:hypothetical protein
MFFPTMTLKIQKKNKRSRTVVAKVPFRMAFFEMEVEFGWKSKCGCTALLGMRAREWW